ncbi:MAG: hypothetical protein ACI8ZM_000456 [Crocinitomix sp.]|jgi:hypothetical protein
MTIFSRNNLLIVLVLIFSKSGLVWATDYHVGPMQPLASIGEVPWADLNAGDRVYIHWREVSYKEKWVINCNGSAENLIEIIGVNGPDGQQPVIDGDNAVTVPGVNFWNESRGIIKIGGSNVPEDGLPTYILIENLEIRSARPGYFFENDSEEMEEYSDNAAAIYVEKCANLTIRNCTLHDAGNGLFVGANGGETQVVLIEKNNIYGNGIVGSPYEHNAYTAAIDIVFQFNHFGSLLEGAMGNNLKDRSAGTVVRYNWIESGSRLIDLVDAEDSEVLVDHPSYATTYVYGNILVKPEAIGNSQILHYGGDSDTYDDYRKGDLYFYNNTVISTREGNTTLINLSTNEETMHVFNNVIYATASGNSLAMINGDGIFNMHHNWLKPDWKDCHCDPVGTVNYLDNIEGTEPGFIDFDGSNFRLENSSDLVDNGDTIPEFLMVDHNVNQEYLEDLDFITRFVDGNIDIGAFENDFGLAIENFEDKTQFYLYPNPVVDVLNFNFVAPFEFEIFNSLSQIVQKGNSTLGTSSVNVDGLESGFYFFIANYKGSTTTLKFVKE